MVEMRALGIDSYVTSPTRVHAYGLTVPVTQVRMKHNNRTRTD